MFLLKYFLKIWSSLFGGKKPKFYIKPEHQTEFVFECGGKKYYKFTSELNIPSQRAFNALDIYQELDCGIDKTHLQGFCKAIIEQTNKGRLVEVANLAKLLEQQTSHITNVNLMYKLASVLYFDEQENPYDYDYVYCENKIKFWQENQKDIHNFFLQLPIGNLIPFGELSKINFQSYTKFQLKEQTAVLNHIIQSLPNTENDKELKERLNSQIIQLQNLLQQIS